jgi:hypothetical protein
LSPIYSVGGLIFFKFACNNSTSIVITAYVDDATELSTTAYAGDINY